MALIWSDDFESYTVGAMQAPWTAGANVQILSGGAGPVGGTKTVGSGISGGASDTTRALGAAYRYLTLDYWIWIGSVGGAAGSNINYVGIDNATGNPFMVAVNQDGSGAVRAGTTTLFTFSGLGVNAWRHFVMTVNLAVAGTATLVVDGTQRGTFSGDTRIDQTPAGATVTRVHFHAGTIGGAPAAQFYVSDLSVTDNAISTSSQARAWILA